jgi:hypothetical protein
MVDPNGSVGRRRTEVLLVMLAILAFLLLLLLYRARAGSSPGGLGARGSTANPGSTQVSLLLPANTPTLGALDIPATGLAASPTSTTALRAPAPAGGSAGAGAAATGGGQHQPTAPARTPVTPPSPATSAPTCAVSAFHYSPPPAQQFATVEAQAGLASISGVSITNGTVSVAPFRSGTKASVQLTATKADPTLPTQWSFVATDVLGRSTVCQ